MDEMKNETLTPDTAFSNLRLARNSGDPEKMIEAAKILRDLSENRGYMQSVVQTIGKAWEVRAGYDSMRDGAVFSTATELLKDGRNYFFVPQVIETGAIPLDKFFPEIDINLKEITSKTASGFQWYAMIQVENKTGEEETVKQILNDSTRHQSANIFHYVISNELSFALNKKYLDEPETISLLLGSSRAGQPLYASYESNGKILLYTPEQALSSGKKIVTKIVRNDEP